VTTIPEEGSEPIGPLPAALLAARLAAGEAALFPTDTLPALAALPAWAARLWELKARPPDKPLILMGADLCQLVEALELPWRGEWLEQANLCWPGAVTLVLPIAGRLTEALHPGGISLGLRVPDCAAAQALLRLSGPLATTSANRSGQPPATCAEEAAHWFPDLPRLAPIPWRAGSGQASTVLAWQEGGAWQVLRSGGVHPPLPGER
jgi:L-threonylcarbamoyladenylate synthase